MIPTAFAVEYILRRKQGKGGDTQRREIKSQRKCQQTTLVQARNMVFSYHNLKKKSRDYHTLDRRDLTENSLVLLWPGKLRWREKRLSESHTAAWMKNRDISPRGPIPSPWFIHDIMSSLIHKDGLKQKNKHEQNAPNLQGFKGKLQVLIEVPLENQSTTVMKDNWLYKYLFHSRANALRRTNHCPFL